MRVLITGSAGFIGRHLTAALQGHDVYGVDLAYGPGERSAPGLRSAWGGDACDWFRLEPDATFDLVLHCAATVGGRAQIDGDPLGCAANLEADAALFRWARRARPGRVVYFSSAAAFPVALQQAPYRLTEDDIDLDDPRMPDQLYGWAKLTGEMLGRRARAEGLAVSVVRPFSGYAGDQVEEEYPFPAFIGRAARREDPFTIWGDGTQVRDLIHADDAVAAILAIAEQGIDGPVSLGTGRAASMTELASMACQAAGYSPEFRYVRAAPSGVRYRVSGSGVLAAIRPPRISLEEGVAQAMRLVSA